jgi:hypothetical protein
VVGEPAAIEINGFLWAESSIRHLAEHGVSPADVEHVRAHGPLVYRTKPGEFRYATHALVGRDGQDRSLIVFISEDADRGLWRVHTAYRARLAHELLEREGRI